MQKYAIVSLVLPAVIIVQVFGALVQETPKALPTPSVGVHFKNNHVLKLEKIQREAWDLVQTKGWRHLTGSCAINISLHGKPEVAVIFSESQNGRITKLQQVIFDGEGRIIRAEQSQNPEQKN